MFGFITDAIETGLDVVSGLVEGELPSSRQVSELVSTGLSVAAIATATGFSIEVIQDLIDD